MEILKKKILLKKNWKNGKFEKKRIGNSEQKFETVKIILNSEKNWKL